MNIEIYTDGSCIKHKGTLYGGYGVHFPDKQCDDVSKKLRISEGPITNQRAELKAILVGLKKCIVLKPDSIKIFSDSEYSIKCVTIWYKDWEKRGWTNFKKQPVKNQDLIQKILKYKNKFKGNLQFQHVYGHGNCKGNIIADKLATSASKGQISKIYE